MKEAVLLLDIHLMCNFNLPIMAVIASLRDSEKMKYMTRYKKRIICLSVIVSNDSLYRRLCQLFIQFVIAISFSTATGGDTLPHA